MKILVDMNLPPKFAKMIADNGIETVHWYNLGSPDAKDVEILTYAQTHNYIVMTCDLDFSTILSVTHGKKPSIVQIRTQDYHTKAVVLLVVDTIKQCEDDLKEGAILTINAKRGRLRLLPL